MKHCETYLQETARIVSLIQFAEIDVLVDELVDLRERAGRLFLIGLGGSAANCSHAANDFRKMCGIESYCLSDGVSELTARANDEGWEHIYSGMLEFATGSDAIMVLSVGGGTEKVSLPITKAIDVAKSLGMTIMGIVGRDGGYTRKRGHAVVVVPDVKTGRVTPHTESFQSVILHCIVSHPKLQKRSTKWTD